MDYQEAEKIRKKSFGTLLGEQEGGLGSSLKSAISQKTKAKITGIKETFDPMNMARAVGGKTGAAIYGKIFKRDDASMERFAGAKKKKTISDSAGTNEKVGEHSTPSDVLGLIYRLMLRANDEKKTQEIDDLEKKKTDEKEENDRNEQIIKAITGRTKKKPTRKEKAKEKKEEVKEKKEAKKEEGKKPPTERKKAPPTEKGKKRPAEKAPAKEAPKEVTKAPPKEAVSTAQKVATGTAIVGAGAKGLVIGALIAAGFPKEAQANILANVDEESKFKPRSEELEKYSDKHKE
jgi:outer membrane biosynthesis protein TonB